MRRSLFPLAAFLLVVPVVLVLVEGRPDSRNAVRAALLVLAGLLFLVAAVRDEVRIGATVIPWNVPFGVAQALLGLTFVSGAFVGVDSGQPIEPVWTVLATLGGGVLLFMGYDFARGGRHFDVSNLP